MKNLNTISFDKHDEKQSIETDATKIVT